MDFVNQDLEQLAQLLAERESQLMDSNIRLGEKNQALEEAKHKLERTIEFSNNLLDYSPDAIWVTDENKKIILYNKVAENLTGYQQQDIINQPLCKLFDQDSHYCHLINQLDQSNHLTNIRASLTKKTGERLELLMSISLLREQGACGRPIGTVTISKDITRELKLENALGEANQRLEIKVRKRTQDLEVLSQSLMVMNQISTVAGQRLEVKTLLKNILNLVLELTGFPMGAMLIADQDNHFNLEAQEHLPEAVDEAIKHIPKGLGVIGEAAKSGFLQTAPPQLEALRASGIGLVVAVPLRALGNISGVMSLFAEHPREIQDEERDMLLAIGIQVAGAIENGRLYEQVQKDINQLREVDRIKSEFIATISHELRTPLTSIIGFLSYALMDFDKANLDKIKRYINIGLENGQKLAHMIEDLLAMQKLESGTLRLRLEPVDLVELLDDIKQDLSPQLQNKEQRLIIDVPGDFPDMLVDKEQLERVLTNLITNAIKFSEQPGKIIIKGTYDGVKKEFCLSVRDSGIGMSAETREHIFDRFYQAENTLTRKTGGTGLGLTIAKRIIEIHNGQLSVESELNQGSCFYIMLPESPNLPEDKERW